MIDEAQKLAERMRNHILQEKWSRHVATNGAINPEADAAVLLPYARALVGAAEALDAILESPASFEDDRIDYAERQVLTESWMEAQSALSDLRALMNKEG